MWSKNAEICQIIAQKHATEYLKNTYQNTTKTRTKTQQKHVPNIAFIEEKYIF